MTILICHERFLFRFGADRVLLLLARGLRELGHRVILAGNRYDEEAAGAFADRIIDVPPDLGAYLDLNELTAEWLRESWPRLFPAGSAPDAVIVGGWPFIAAIPFFRQVCRKVLFIDFGVVPAEGYSEGMTTTLAKLKRLRGTYLKHASMVVGISDFIVSTQSRMDAGADTPVRSVLLGADHVEMAVWPQSQVKDTSAGRSLKLVQNLKRDGKKVVFGMGRWEPGCYKNSQAAFEVMEKLLSNDPDCCLLVLEKEGSVTVPPHLTRSVFPVGFPDDAELAGIMKEADLGISMSLWEGFNLPLAEMQWLGRPALVLAAGAHPEVVAHPWYLCRDIDEMVVKARAILHGSGLDQDIGRAAMDRFRQVFTWKRLVDEYAAILGDPIATVVVDVTNSAKDPANSGVVRVTRRLCRELQRHADPIFVVWEAALQRYVLPTSAEHAQLSEFNGPLAGGAGRLSKSFADRTVLEEVLQENSAADKWLVLPETMIETEFVRVRRFAKSARFRIAAIFYDAIPVLRPDLCNEEMRNNHASYMRGLAECNAAIPISLFSADCLRRFWLENSVAGECQIVPNLLPGEFAGTARNLRADNLVGDEVRILCVSTLEPRKNHRNLIQACLQMENQHPELNWSLTLIGNRYAGAFDIAEWVQRIAASNPRVRWLGIVDDATLERHYIDCWFTVYASTIEGFGLPIMESIWHGRPCICDSDGVMAELAVGGGCLTADVMDTAALSESIYHLSTNAALRMRLAQEAVGRPMKTWDEYGLGVLKTLGSVAVPSARAVPENATGWDAVLYKNCLCENWQMNDSERMALMGLLARHKPNCSIEVGTFCGGSLSLISQFSSMVFSIDIDPEIPKKFAYFQNVSFLTGPSTLLLPHLFNELDAAGIGVDFLLIDGDHSTDGVRKDIECLLRYVPRTPMFVMLHDSFNPECRRGMLAAQWGTSPYCHWVDLDFVPGRAIEHGGDAQGELWGGLAAAYFAPSRRSGPLSVGTTASRMFRALGGDDLVRSAEGSGRS